MAFEVHDPARHAQNRAPGGKTVGEHGRVDHWRFQRPTLSLQVYIEGESDDSPEQVTHHCVKMITAE